MSIVTFFLACGLVVSGILNVNDGNILAGSITLSVASVLYSLVFAPGWQEDF